MCNMHILYCVSCAYKWLCAVQCRYVLLSPKFGKYPKNAYLYRQFLIEHKFDSNAVKIYYKWFVMGVNPETGMCVCMC